MSGQVLEEEWKGERNIRRKKRTNWRPTASSFLVACLSPCVPSRSVVSDSVRPHGQQQWPCIRKSQLRASSCCLGQNFQTTLCDGAPLVSSNLSDDAQMFQHWAWYCFFVLLSSFLFISIITMIMINLPNVLYSSVDLVMFFLSSLTPLCGDTLSF